MLAMWLVVISINKQAHGDCLPSDSAKIMEAQSLWPCHQLFKPFLVFICGAMLLISIWPHMEMHYLLCICMIVKHDT